MSRENLAASLLRDLSIVTSLYLNAILLEERSRKIELLNDILHVGEVGYEEIDSYKKCSVGVKKEYQPTLVEILKRS